jgi:hypothetical protein
MTDFDPYHRWLGIAKDQRPPNHYQLLGVPVGEADLEVIEEAAVRQSAHVRTYQLGAHAADCARILNEIALAKTVLLNPQKKRDYDAKLMVPARPAAAEARLTQDNRIAAAPLPRPARPGAGPEVFAPDADADDAEPPWISGPAPMTRPSRDRPIRRETWLTPGVIVGAAVSATVFLGLIVLLVMFLSRDADSLPNPDKVRKAPVAKGPVGKAPVGKPAAGVKGDPRVEAPGKHAPIVDPKVKNWDQLDTTGFAIEEDFVRVNPGMICTTKQEHSGPLEITAIARTPQHNIRLHAFKGACVIFNWELNINELRVNRPDGNENRESGSLTSAQVEPLEFNTWHTLRWRIDVDGMQVLVNDKSIFLERRPNDLADARKVGIGAMTHPVDVRYFDVKPLKRGLGEP